MVGRSGSSPTGKPPEGGQSLATHRRIEIVHESLLSAWPRLVRWRTQDVEGAQLRDQLHQAARLWEERGRPDDLLWTGTSFKEYELWRDRYEGGLTEQERSFAGAMELRATRRKRRRRTIMALVVVLSVGVAAVTGGLWRRSETARRQAVSEARRAEASKLLALAQLRREKDPTEALAYTAASLELSDSSAARRLAVELLWAAPPAREIALSGAELAYKFPVFSPDGNRLAIAGHGSEVAVLASAGGPPVLLPGHPAQRPRWAFWAANDLLVTEDAAGPGGYALNAYVWRLPAGKRLRTIELGGPSTIQTWPGVLQSQTRLREGGQELLRLRAWSLPDGGLRELGSIDLTELDSSTDEWRVGKSALLPDGRGWLYAKAGDVCLRPLPARADAPDRVLGRHAADIAWLWPLSIDPLRFYSRDANGEIRVWALSGEESPLRRVLPPPPGAYDRLEPHPGGRWLAGDVFHSAMREQEFRIWNLKAWPEARPLTLRRDTSWYHSSSRIDPRGDWIVLTTGRMGRATFWPLPDVMPWIVDGYERSMRPIAFSPDGRWLATAWSGSTLRLWPLPGSGSHQPLSLPTSDVMGTFELTFDPESGFVFGAGFRAGIVPLDDSPPRPFPESFEETVLGDVAVSPSGRYAATAFEYGDGAPLLRVWDLESGTIRRFDLPAGSLTAGMYRRGVMTLAFGDDSTLYTAGDGGVRRWDLESGRHDLLLESPSDHFTVMAVHPDRRTALVLLGDEELDEGRSLVLLDLATGSSRPPPDVPLQGFSSTAFDIAAEVAAFGYADGVVRVLRLSGGPPHLMFGHEGPIDRLAISPDGRWIATTGEDDTLRLWPMPDLDRQPLHTLPLEELLGKLRSLTNLRVIPDSESPEGWAVTLAPFPGWAEVPEW